MYCMGSDLLLSLFQSYTNHNYQPTNLVLTLRQQLGPHLCPHHTRLHQQNINHISAMHAVSPSCQTTKHMPQKYSPLQNMIPSIKTCQTFVAVLTLYSKDLFLDKACIVHSPTIFFVTTNIQVQIEVVLQKLLHFIL